QQTRGDSRRAIRGLPGCARRTKGEIMNPENPVSCPECGDSGIDRREFFKVAGAAVIGTAAAVLTESPAESIGRATAIKSATGTPESLVKTLYNSLNEKQKGAIALPWEDKRRK